MNKKLSTITIGIPAFNEEANIAFLIGDLLKQKEDGFKIEKIIIYSDGSTDKTVKILSSYKNRKIKILESKVRRGHGLRQNLILSKTNSDVLVLLNADVRIVDVSFIKNLIQPILKQGIDLTSANLKAVDSHTLIAKVLESGELIKSQIFDAIDKGQNVYTCHGPARAFSKRIIAKFKFKGSLGEDAYSFFYCQFYGYKYKYVKKAICLYKLPETISDHEKQSIRFLRSKRSFVKEFGEGFINKQYDIPVRLYIKGVSYSFFKLPLLTFSYLALNLIIRIRYLFLSEDKSFWEVAGTSKMFVITI